MCLVLDEQRINLLVCNAPFLYPLKTSETLRLSDVFKEQRKGALGTNWLSRQRFLLRLLPFTIFQIFVITFLAICLRSKIRGKQAWAKVFTAKNKKYDTEFWSDFSFTLFRVQFEQCFRISHMNLQVSEVTTKYKKNEENIVDHII